MEKKEAMKILKDFHDKSALFSVRTALDTIIPELKESEDEKIRKELIQRVIHDGNGRYTYNKNDYITWLEKQGKQKPTEWNREDEQNLNACLGYIPDEFLRRWLTDAIHAKYDKSTDKGESNLLTVERAKEMSPFMMTGFEDRFAAWSEEDEKFVHGLIRGLSAKRDIHGHTTFSSDCIDITETINWLESLKNRVLLYPVSVEYNEEDIDNIADMFIPEPAWNALEESEGEGSNAAAYDYSQMIAMFKAGVHWLKPLRHQNTWKPSDEQIKALETTLLH